MTYVEDFICHVTVYCLNAATCVCDTSLRDEGCSCITLASRCHRRGNVNQNDLRGAPAAPAREAQIECLWPVIGRAQPTWHSTFQTLGAVGQTSGKKREEVGEGRLSPMITFLH